MYLAEFALHGTTELADELLIQAPSQGLAHTFAQEYASNWGLDLFSLTPADDRQIKLYRRMGRAITIQEAESSTIEP